MIDQYNRVLTTQHTNPADSLSPPPLRLRSYTVFYSKRLRSDFPASAQPRLWLSAAIKCGAELCVTHAGSVGLVTGCSAYSVDNVDQLKGRRLVLRSADVL